MQVISLNILGGAFYGPLQDFINREALQTDFFCFQEVYQSDLSEKMDGDARTNILADLQSWLPGFESHFEPVQAGFPKPGVTAGMVIFVRKGISVQSSGKVPIHDTIYSAGNELEPPVYIQYVRLANLTLAHIHGIVYPGSKVDTPERLDQSRRVNEFLAKENPPKILCGDFNLDRDAESIVLIEKGGMRNLIKEFHIMTTRSELNYAKYPAHDRQYFADYAFVSSDMKVVNFEVPVVNVSDHLPLKLQFE
ncbi:MAG: hypothetical protein A3J07_04015 [Candidatus Doudnabacteria bacterium RIFCSPLOWO2_02_FULL_49_13]|uniref:Endonuclease/exonuclease/phosphatase domain-containing protein n=1 Tax=Candidatus Doudnabacteria bacterium RIFCSPHIGHO2_12_FULL_48_16 TaxID=1817838 RepID=A0A1F5PK85_9BACT|nr:MAG: hypothetical protein A3B77_02825 [Candidatus Doudnabacteria bacterium RIFCSPHIGHO2_02_FULL_49_24]OGE90082.1 MAG: hypothetical protein A3E29_03160 [Candidatus Doudnabacteria bacterium RIFCSPHIGHO2_12_FULL_48_16]OGE90450.1 MAG: hypothetical protein A2760_00800 [Candidatus Doudnabacteria bacterium RIFCSPHIGHO2_01_FULL_50_67]OGE96506.1 MAG: hypothetical protein A2990_04545 [Candidatus Doudnabacteria bacterium RIFCSPLOWO2_01_FULL_49_40]OGF03225.1 MAG: hypothetical protein A3J07_04015 [Candid